MTDCGHFFILLVITLSMLAFTYTNAIKGSRLLKGFTGVCMLFAGVVLVRIFGDVVPDLAIKILLSVSVCYFFYITLVSLSPKPSVSDFS